MKRNKVKRRKTDEPQDMANKASQLKQNVHRLDLDPSVFSEVAQEVDVVLFVLFDGLRFLVRVRVVRIDVVVTQCSRERSPETQTMLVFFIIFRQRHNCEGAYRYFS